MAFRPRLAPSKLGSQLMFMPNLGSLTEGGRISMIDFLVLTSLYQLLFILTIYFFFITKQALLKRRSTVLSLPLQLAFPGQTHRLFYKYVHLSLPLPLELACKIDRFQATSRLVHHRKSRERYITGMVSATVDHLEITVLVQHLWTKISYLTCFTKQATLMRSQTVLSHPQIRN
jgi:hypothetical protein